MKRRSTVVRLVRVTAAIVLAFEVLAYEFGPPRLDRILRGYRAPATIRVGGRLAYLQHYFQPHSERGFDIGANRSGRHYVNGLGTYDIWSNSLGCFDRLEPERTSLDDFIYLAGDSVTWGYTPYRQKFGTILEQTLHYSILKCGVTHTGQRYQFSKFRDIVNTLGRMPTLVVVNFVPNDVANDYAYPHSTVIDGWLVDKVLVDRMTNAVVEIPRHVLERQIAQRLAPRTLRSRVKEYASRYSASYHILWALFHLAEPTAERYQTFYALNMGADRYLYRKPLADANKSALRGWRDHARQHKYQFVVALVPSPETQMDVGYYAELEEFLQQEGIRFANFSRYAYEHGITAEDSCWPRDGHFNLIGNRAYAEFLAQFVRPFLTPK